jgi:hypothetical protein
MKKTVLQLFTILTVLLCCSIAKAQTTLNNNNAPVTANNMLPVSPYDFSSTNNILNASALNSAIVVPLLNTGSKNSVTWQVTGLTNSGATLIFEVSVDGGATWTPKNVLLSNSPTTTIMVDGTYRENVAGFTNVRLRVSTVGSGSITISYVESNSLGDVNLGTSPPLTEAVANNNSGTITTGGTFQILLPYNPSRKGCLIQNPTNATENLEVFIYNNGSNGSPTGTPSVNGSFDISQGGTYSCTNSAGVVTPNQIAVEAATTGHIFKESDQ